MNKWTKRLTVIGVCAAITLGCTGVAFAEKEQPKTVENRQVETSEEEKITKDETVYVLANADGTVQKLIVSDWIKNDLKSDTVNDQSELSDIENVKGDESYTLGGDGSTVWDAQGNDIYYQGNIEKELPVNLTVSYFLDGKSVTAEELAGKSGRVTIRFDYENRQYETVEIDGKQEKIYVPFVMLTGMLLDNDTFRNIEVSNGRLINDGDRTAVVALAFPGLQENLGIDRETLELPDSVEITADAENFSFGMTVTLATNSLFSELGDIDLSSADGLTDALTALTDAMTQLTDGSSALYDGLCTLLEKSDELVAGIDRLAAGAKAIRDGAASVDAGAATLKTKLNELSGGLGTLSESSATLNAGAAQVFTTLLSTAQSQLTASGIAVPTLTAENYAEVLGGVITSLEQISPEAAQTVAALKSSLDSYNTFYVGLCTYTAGVDSAASGAAQLAVGASDLKDGTADLKAGAATLYDGVLTLQNGAPALVSGVTQLKDGAMQLSDGLKQFSEQGVEKLTALLEDDLGALTARLKATVEVSERYRSFAGLGDDMDGQVKFIYRTDEIDCE